MSIRSAMAVFALGVMAGPALAEVTSLSASGFETVNAVQIDAAPGAVYDLLLAPSQWWDGEHSFSGEAGNFSLEVRPGGCFCEMLGDAGFVEHLRVVHAQPGREIRLTGALGPLQPLGVSGAMSWRLEPNGRKTEVVFTYNVGGHLENGFDDWAPSVDRVVAEQLQRLKRRVETGKAG